MPSWAVRRIYALIKNYICTFYLFSTGYFIKEIKHMFSVFSFNFRNTCGRLWKLVITVETFALLVRFPTEISRFSKLPLVFSKNLVVYYCKYCNLIGYATRYLFVNRYRVAVSNATRPSSLQKNNLKK